MKYILDKENGVPIYKQIIEQITQAVKNGELKSGDKILPERELSNILNISRGTVTKAYIYLERSNIIETVQGKGSFISKTQDVVDGTRKDKAVQIITDTIKNLEELKFSHKEIRIFFDIILMQRKTLLKKINIMVIDCNYEALSVFGKQLMYIPDVRIKKVLIDELKKSTNIDIFLGETDFVITTINHYNEVKELLDNKIRVIEAAVITSQQTIIDISKIRDKSKIGIICKSKRFQGIILDTLKLFNISNIKSIEDQNNLEFEIEKMIKRDVIIMPAYSDIYNDFIHIFKKFEESGGKIINFEYQIERGSLLYIEEVITHFMKNKNNI